MAEYYAVLSRAVASLEANTPETRRAVYDKARNALIGQLKAIVPPLPTSEISRQRLELEEAIRRAEREAANGGPAGSPQRPTRRPGPAAGPPPQSPPPQSASPEPPPQPPPPPTPPTGRTCPSRSRPAEFAAGSLPAGDPRSREPRRHHAAAGRTGAGSRGGLWRCGGGVPRRRSRTTPRAAAAGSRRPMCRRTTVRRGGRSPSLSRGWRPTTRGRREAPPAEPALPRSCADPAARRRRQTGADPGWPAQGQPRSRPTIVERRFR